MSGTTSLRPAQQRAFQLPGWKTGFLWGPPGTGKTHTLGRMLAAKLEADKTSRILLLSSTNVAVDLAILEADKSFSNSQQRPLCYRFGSRFDPKLYRERRHLLPLHDKNLVEQLRQHLELVPDPADTENYHRWKKKREALRDAIRAENRAFLSRAQLVAMTTTLAAHDFAHLGSFDLVVFDEASQVSKVAALTFGHLGKHVLFAGDDKQLSPIAQANGSDVDDWLGSSPFKWKDQECMKPATCFLNEQWRMAPDICSAVSKESYGSGLVVAEPALTDAKWVNYRKPLPTKLLGDQNLVLVETPFGPTTGAGFKSYECRETARLVAAFMVDHVLSWGIVDPKSEILVLTPFRAQRRRIEQELNAIGAPQSLASTVHRSQGSERRIVIFDPVCPSAEFVNGDAGKRLLNVGFSRAESRLIVILQRGWREHQVLREMAKDFAPIRVSRQLVDELLLLKLPKAPKAPPVVKQTKPQVLPLDTADALRNDLRRALSQGIVGRALTDRAAGLRRRYRDMPQSMFDNILEEMRRSN